MSKEKREFYSALIVPTALLLLIWVIKIYEVVFNVSLSNYGLKPHSIEGLIGILTMPFLHADFSHLSSNSLAFFVLLSGLYLFYKSFATTLVLEFYLFTGFATWIIGSEGEVHIGASGIVYCLAWFHIISGFIKRNKQQAAFGLLVIFLYGSVVWGIFPMFQPSAHISWQGHLAGAITGVVLSILYKDKGIQKQKEEDNDDPSDEDPYWLEENNEL